MCEKLAASGKYKEKLQFTINATQGPVTTWENVVNITKYERCHENIILMGDALRLFGGQCTAGLPFYA